jgi:hypothetical protein
MTARYQYDPQRRLFLKKTAKVAVVACFPAILLKSKAQGQLQNWQRAVRAEAQLVNRATGLPTPNILTQDFESGSSSAPSGWYANSGCTWNYTPAIRGSYSWGIAAGGSGYPDLGGGGRSGFYLCCQLSIGVFFTGVLIGLQGPSPTYTLLATVETNPSGQLIVSDGDFAHYGALAGSLLAGTKYWLFFRFATGTGSNAITSAAFSTTESEPTSGSLFSSLTNGDSVGNAEYVTFYNRAASGNVVVDHVGIATFDMPNGW